MIMGKLQEILSTGQAPGLNTNSPSDRDPDKAVPRAFKSLSNNDVNKFVKESGFSVNHVKRVWQMAAVLALFLAGPVPAQELNSGYSFTSTDRVTSTKLNNLVGLGSINAAFYTTKAATVPVSSDTFLLARGSTFFRVPFSSMSVNNTNIITDQAEDFAPGLYDYLLTLDVTSGLLAKTTLSNAVFYSANLIQNRTNWLTPDQNTTYVLAWDSTTGEFSKLSRSNYLFNAFNFTTWTNLETLTLADPDQTTFPVWDSVTGTNRQTSLSGLVNLTPVYITNGNADYVFMQTNGVLSRIALGDFKAMITSTLLPEKFASSEVALSATGSLINTAHGLSGTPQAVHAVLVCQSTEANYDPGDELDISQTGANPTLGALIFNWSGNTTNVSLAYNSSFAPVALDKSSGAATTLTPGKWKAKIYAEYFP